MMLIFALVILGLFAVIGWQSFAGDKARCDFAKEREQWTTERSELLNRIQHPEALPVPGAPAVTDEELRQWQLDDIGLVGTVVENGATD